MTLVRLEVKVKVMGQGQGWVRAEHWLTAVIVRFIVTWSAAR